MASEGRERPSRGLVLTIAALQLVLGLLLVQIYLTSHNSLYNNGNWSVGKTQLWNGLIGSYSFLFDLQPLTGGFLNIAAWHGYQEVVLERELDPVSIEFDFYLAHRNSSVTLSFNRAGADYAAIRLSRQPQHPAALLSVSPEGEFLKKRLLPALNRVPLKEWQTFRLELADNTVSAFLGDREVKKLEKRRMKLAPRQKIGFRGGSRAAYVDNIRIVSRDGSEFRETFSRPRNWRIVYLVVIGGLALLVPGAFWALRRSVSVSDRILLFFFLMTTGVLLVAAAAVLGFASYTKGFYPNASEKLRRQEAYWVEATAEQLAKDIEERYTRSPGADVYRFVVLGASQTAGAGAPSEEATWVRRTEHLLNQRADGVVFELINTAVRGYRLNEILRDFEKQWVHWRPATLIVNVSHNDQGAPERFESLLTRLVQRARDAGIEVVLVQEPNAGIKVSTRLLRNHQIMASVGDRFGVPVIDVQGPLASRGDDGFLWWDQVHMTAFGQRLFAEILAERLEQLGIVTAAGAVDPDTRGV